MKSLAGNRALVVILALIFIGTCAIIGVCAVGFALSPAPPARLPTLTPTTVPTDTPAPTATTGPTATPIIFEFQGQGDDVIRFTTPAGLATFIFSHRGEGNFMVTLLDSQGEYIDLLVNEIGDYDGERVEQVKAGEYVLEITATGGGWAAVIAPPQ